MLGQFSASKQDSLNFLSKHKISTLIECKSICKKPRFIQKVNLKDINFKKKVQFFSLWQSQLNGFKN